MYIYKITNLVNNKIYIGQTINSVQSRFSDHCKPSRNKSGIDRAIKKYGKENFIVETICNANSIEELNELEKFYIKKYNAMNKSIGYNLCEGGDNTCGYHHTKASRKKMSENRKITQKGSKNNFYGRHHTEESKKKMSIAKKGKPLTKEWRQHLSDTSPRKQKVICITTNERFNSIHEAAEKFGIESTHISRVCRGKRKSCGGFQFKYDNTVPSSKEKV